MTSHLSASIVCEFIVNQMLIFCEFCRYKLRAFFDYSNNQIFGDLMKTNHTFFASVLVIVGISFGILTAFELPESIMQWIISDTVLGMLLYMSYLTIALQYDHSQGDFSTELPSGLA